MATKKWADEEEVHGDGGHAFEAFDDQGNKVITEYVKKNGRTVKVTTKYKIQKIEKSVNKNALARKGCPKFGAELADSKGAATLSPDEVYIEATQRSIGVVQDEYDKFLEAEVEMQLSQKKKQVGAWVRTVRDEPEQKPAVGGFQASQRPGFGKGQKGQEQVQTDAGGRDAQGKYVPPGMRAGAGKGGGKGGGDQMREEFTLRVFNLSTDVREGDLHELFGQFGKLWRVFLAKNPETQESKGFAFVTYCSKGDAERAIAKLHGHGYDNLILSVAFARPRANQRYPATRITNKLI